MNKFEYVYECDEEEELESYEPRFLLAQGDDVDIFNKDYSVEYNYFFLDQKNYDLYGCFNLYNDSPLYYVGQY